MDPGQANIIFIIAMVAIFYLVLVRPQQRRVRKHQEVIAALKPGDEVVTIGGLHGYIKRLEDAVVHLEVAPGVVLRFMRSAVRDKVTSPGGDADVSGGVEHPEGTDTPA